MQNIFEQGFFNVSDDATPDDLARKRAQIGMAMQGTPRYAVGGLGKLATGIVGGIRERNYGRHEDEKRSEASALFDRIMGGSGGSPAGYGGQPSLTTFETQPQVSSRAAPPTPEEQVGADARAAIGAPAPPVQAEISGPENTAFNKAASQLGMNERDQQGALQEYMANGGVNLDPAVTAWCAAFVNASLGQSGIKGTGSNAARSFMDWGQGVSDPQRGDLAVFSRGDPNGWQGHVGFFDGYNDDGSINVLGGNQGDSVSRASYSADRLLGFRRAADGVSSGGIGPIQEQATSGPPLADLLQMQANPWLSAEQKAVVNNMIGVQQQANDPLRQLQIAQAQQNLYDSQNPQAAATNLPSSVVELQWRAEQAGLQPGTPEYQSFIMNGGADPATFRALDMQAKAAGYQEGTPEYAEFMATRGAGQQAFARTSGQNAADVQTGGAAASAVAQGRAEGTEAAASNAELLEMQRNMPGLEQVIDQLDTLAGTATFTAAGRARDEVARQFGIEPTDGAIARAEYIAIVDNQVLPLLRQTFGAAFTAKEGETLRATLGNENASPAEKRAVLQAFISQKRRDIEARVGTPSDPSAPADLTADDLRYLGLD